MKPTWVGIYIRGLAIGLVELIPGVSGGTIALITGIYSRLLSAISKVSLTWLRLIFNWLQGKAPVREVIQHIDGRFLGILLLGMATAVLVFAELISYLIQEHSLLLMAFFFGLILGSIYLLIRQGGRLMRSDIPILLAGILIGVGLTKLHFFGIRAEPAVWIIILAGGISSCAWILPGISGSFILLTLGMYKYLIEAIVTKDVFFVTLFGLGMAVGLPIFSRVLANLLHKHKRQTLWFLVALVCGTLHQLWPWQRVLSYYHSPDTSQAISLATQPVLPHVWQRLTGEDPMVLGALTLALIGMAIIVLTTELKWTSPV